MILTFSRFGTNSGDVLWGHHRDTTREIKRARGGRADLEGKDGAYVNGGDMGDLEDEYDAEYPCISPVNFGCLYWIIILLVSENGMHDEGEDPNDFEIEEIVSQEGNKDAPYQVTFAVQNWGSIPLSWSQKPYSWNAKPGILSSRVCIANYRECIFFLGVNQRPLIVGDNHKLQVAFVPDN